MYVNGKPKRENEKYMSDREGDLPLGIPKF